MKNYWFSLSRLVLFVLIYATCVYFIQEQLEHSQKRSKSLFNFNYSQIETVALYIVIWLQHGFAFVFAVFSISYGALDL